MASPIPPPPIPGVPSKRKTSLVVWILLGIAGFIFLCGVAVVATGWFFFQKVRQAGVSSETMRNNPAVGIAKILAAVNPDIELLKVDEDRGVVIVRNTKEDKIYRLNFEDLKKGKVVYQEEGKDPVSVEVQQGAAAEHKLPGWFPTYPGMKVEGLFSLESGEGDNLSFSFTTADSVDKVARFFDEELNRAGWKVNSNLLTQNNVRTGGVVQADDEKGRTVIVNLEEDNGKTKAGVTVTTKK
jgi:hypothetical protein